MITITPYNLDCEEVEGLNITTTATTIEGAAKELNQPIINSTEYWILCGSGEERYLITKEKSPLEAGHFSRTGDPNINFLSNKEDINHATSLHNNQVETKTTQQKREFIEQIQLDLIYH